MKSLPAEDTPMLMALKKSATLALESASAANQAAMREAIDNDRQGLRVLMQFAGPAVIASVGYMDPGNFATNIQAGSTFGYQLLWVVLAANLFAMLFQAMSAKIGIVTGRNLAELCRDEFPKPIVIAMWLGSELAAMATDLAEFIGAAIAISLLFHLSIGWGLAITGVVTATILLLEKHGFRPLEILIAGIVSVIGLSYLIELVIAPPDWRAAAFHTFVPQLQNNEALNLAVGIIGATIMPHTIYLHSGLTQRRTPVTNDHERRKLLRFSNKEVVIALGFAGMVNMAMVAVSASVFRKTAPGISDITAAYHTLAPALGMGAAVVFLVALLASGISSSVVGTMAGQTIMQGFVGFRIPVLVRRMVTMVPAVFVAMTFDPMKALVESQVVLSLILPMPLIALVVLSSRRSVMRVFVADKKMLGAAVTATAMILVMNAVLLWQTFTS